MGLAKLSPLGSSSELLIVQGHSLLSSAFGRFLEPHFARIHVAMTLQGADEILSGGAGAQITHIICGHYFGDSGPGGASWLRACRVSYPWIERTVLATASELAARDTEGVDAVFSKPSEPSELIQVLRIESDEEEAPESAQIASACNQRE